MAGGDDHGARFDVAPLPPFTAAAWSDDRAPALCTFPGRSVAAGRACWSRATSPKPCPFCPPLWHGAGLRLPGQDAAP